MGQQYPGQHRDAASAEQQPLQSAGTADELEGQLQTLQSFANLSVNPTDPQYVATVIDNDCNYVTFINPSTNAPVAPTAAPRQPQRRLR